MRTDMKSDEGVLSTLAEFSRVASASLPLSEKLALLARLAGRLLEADLCLILELERSPCDWVVRAASAPDREIGAIVSSRLLPLEGDGPARSIVDPDRGAMPVAPMQALRDLAPPNDYASMRSAALTVGAQLVGLLCCYYHEAGQPDDGEQQPLLTIVSNQTALALHYGLLAEEQERTEPIAELFDALRSGGAAPAEQLRVLAGSLGCNLALTHAVVEVEIACCGGSADAYMAAESRLAFYRGVFQQVRRSLLQTHPGSVFREREHRLTCLLCLSRDPTAGRMRDQLSDLLSRVDTAARARVFVAAANPCRHLSDYPLGFKEAGEALQIGRFLKHNGGLVLFNDLGASRYLYRIALQEGPPDRIQELVGRIADYDRARTACLLQTLEVYLECGGHLTMASGRLFIHRNTLIQRLERLQSLCVDIDLENRDVWLQLQLVIKVYQLRQQLQGV